MAFIHELEETDVAHVVPDRSLLQVFDVFAKQPDDLSIAIFDGHWKSDQCYLIVFILQMREIGQEPSEIP